MKLAEVRQEAELRALAEGGLLPEGHQLEAKRLLGTNKSANQELARDLASLSIKGGWLVIGLAEDADGNPTVLHAVPLDGLAEQVEQVADSLVHPRLVVRFHPVEASTGPATGYLLVEVPASPSAPHMVDGRFYGRGDKTKHRLSEAEVDQLYLHRQQRSRSVEALLDDEEDRDPTNAQGPLGAPLSQQAHLYAVLAPTIPVAGRLHDALTTQGTSLRQWVQTDLVRGGPAAIDWLPWGPFTPDVDDSLSAATRAGGVGMHSSGLTQGRTIADSGSIFEAPPPDKERKLIDFEVDEDGTLRLFAAGVSASIPEKRGGGRRFIASLPAGLVTRLLRAGRKVAEVSAYGGTWDLGLRIRNLQGVKAPGDLTYEPDVFSAPRYEATGRLLTEDLVDEQRVVAELCGRLYRGFGMTLDS
jgi:hypothetical protein